MHTSCYPQRGILLVDDEEAFLRSMSVALERQAGFSHLYRCQDSRQAMSMLATHPIGIVLLDLTMPYLSGEELLSQISAQHPDISVIIISGLNQLETAMDCIRSGAFDYYVKTTEERRLIDGIKRAVQMQQMQAENQALRQRVLSDTLEQPEVFAQVITQNKAMRAIFQYLESISTSLQPVLISGESGVGKEQIAQAIHTLSRSHGPLISVNVAGLDDNVFSDTLFGHRRGAFTGADTARSGMIEQATGGTLFLDEIGDLSPASQVKLLRLIQEGEYYPLGSDRPKRLRARIIAATHQDLEAKLASNDFRNDLYYRLKVHHVEVPPLRQRLDDLPLLLDYFLAEAAKELSKSTPTAPKELYALLSHYHWPGNIRELKALVYDAVSRHKARVLSMDVFRQVIHSESKTLDTSANASDRVYFPSEKPLPTVQEINQLLIDEAMTRAQGNQSLAARLIGLSQPALNKRLKKSAP
ncbi:sigma-54-dependent transcriptional regulator [Marinomonas fungiae]|uniref:DNA-binding transcriptional response regulator, NtrC family, contains REC, AAA-type ATPase, and a Fis-type DNA-binding domains n=1 Tax=Marinomonas fungiae TaxID=1137284 RepID=A0A0K6IK83_9GAMM|nr:sigma-54 dependent transcriptional regulator [Marinomonas fungiae]CUB03712.1 DNA-binding transcriptional response regulator, NtrC family, contains REC, AAA-type ATPase, and a Fis-type DNA-binding domains [Marinomonas fungiae]